jgi:uncharacterized protein YndB with AHSA1/START domain
VEATAERTIGIRRPADQVFRYLSDGRTATQWRSGTLDIRRVEPETRIAFAAAAARLRLEGTFELEAIGDGTILTCTLRADVPGWRGMFLPGAARSALETELAALDELRDLLER